MWGMTLGQVYVLLGGMGEYLRLTNPFGSGESNGSTSPRSAKSTVGKDEFGALEGISSRIPTHGLVKVRERSEFGAFEQSLMREVMEG